MSLIDDLGRNYADARQARALAHPMTDLAVLTPEEADSPAARQIVRLRPGAAIPEQKPEPEPPARLTFTRGSYGKTIPVSFGQRRLTGTIIQSTALVPRLVGNTEYEVTYEIPAVEDQTPVEEVNDGDPPPRQVTIWCNDCNCYYCYQGPLDVNTPFSLTDKGTWPYMAMMGRYQSRLCTSWDYFRFASIDEDYNYGALLDKDFGHTVRWNYRPPNQEINGLPSAIPTLTCGPCAGEAPYPDSVENKLERSLSAVDVKAPMPYTTFVYFGYILWHEHLFPEEVFASYRTNYTFYYAVMTELALNYAHVQELREGWDDGDPEWNGPDIDDVRVYRIYYDPNAADDEHGDLIPGQSGEGEPEYLLPGWKFYDTVWTGEGNVWQQSQAIRDLNYLGSAPYWNPTGPTWREYVREHGGWAPEDEPDGPPDYRMLTRRRIDPNDAFSEFKTYPAWEPGMLIDFDAPNEPTHLPGGTICTSITDYSDV